MFPAINLYNILGDLPASAQELKMSQLGLEIDVTDERGNCGNDVLPWWIPGEPWAIYTVYLPVMAVFHRDNLMTIWWFFCGFLGYPIFRHMLGFCDIPESWENWEILGEENLRHTMLVITSCCIWFVVSILYSEQSLIKKISQQIGVNRYDVPSKCWRYS